MAIVGAIALGIVMGLILAYLLNILLRGFFFDAASASREGEQDAEINRLEKEIKRLKNKEKEGGKYPSNDDKDEEEY